MEEGAAGALPDADDLQAWKATDDRLIRRAMRAIDHQVSGLKRLTARYFGGADARGWIDQEIPMLGGRTPREAVSTSEGRRQVQELLRTYLPSQGPGGMVIEPPVDEMRRLLGLPPEEGDDRGVAGEPSKRPQRSGIFDAREKRKRKRAREKKARRAKGKKRRT